jgi:hypothetical protein
MLYKQERRRVRSFRGVYYIPLMAMMDTGWERKKKKGKENASGMVDFIQVSLESGTMDASGKKSQEG